MSWRRGLDVSVTGLDVLAAGLDVDEVGLVGRACVGQDALVYRGGVFQAAVTPDGQPGVGVGREAPEGGTETLVEERPSPLVGEGGDGQWGGEHHRPLVG